jgi:hypothetical protein
MRTSNKPGFLILSVCIAFVIISCGDIPMSEYQPKNQDEREIVSLLMKHQDAKNHFDIDKLLPLLHNEGKFSFECGRMISKRQLKTELPGFWADIKSGNTAIIPIVHECINGDYFKTGELNNPKIVIHSETARAAVLFTNGVCRIEQYFSLVRENHKWLINRTEWGDH